MNLKLSVTKVHPKVVKHVREVAEGKATANHPVYDVTKHTGTGKATCRGCGEIIKEGEDALLFWNARFDEGHDLSFIRDRSVIHANGCTDGPLIRCPHCSDEVTDGALGAHISEAHGNRFQWALRPRAASIRKMCMLHKLERCGQCEEDRELEEPKLREELKKLLEITASSNDEKILEYFDEPEGYVEDLEPHYAAGPGQRSTRDVAQEVTDKVIKSLEGGKIPWQQPWTAAKGMLPTSAHGRPYRGINLLLLGMEQQEKGYDNPIWITYDQAKKLGGSVRKGEKSTLVTFRKSIRVPDKNAVPEPGKDPKLKTVPVLRHYNLFNLTQTDGVQLPPRLQKITDRPKSEPVEVLPAVQNIMNGYKGGPPVSHVNMAIGAPNYSPSKDTITLPHPHQFESPEAYAATAFHELVHSTGHSSRLDRFAATGEPQHFGSERYAHEELVAELGNSMLLGHAGIANAREDTQTAGYIQNWLQALKNDKNFVIRAAGTAQKATDHILGINPEEFKDEEESSERTSAKWRHTEDEGFDMWETTEDHNQFAIIEADNKYDLYELKGSFDSPEDAKAAADGNIKVAQDGGGGGASGGGSSGGGDGGGSSGGGDGGGDAGGSSAGDGGDASGDSGYSSGSDTASESESTDSGEEESDGDEDPRSPTGKPSDCPRCGDKLNPIYITGGRVYTCMNCGWTYRKKKRLESSWFDRIPSAGAQSAEPTEPQVLSIDPVVPPLLLEDGTEAINRKNQNPGQLFSMN